MAMRKSHLRKFHDPTSRYPDVTRHIHDPLGLAASRPIEAHDSAHTASQPEHDTSVNPLWMITAGLAAFLILLVAVW
jgi:hypothetical protein